MADFPAHLAHEHRLPDGRTICIRPVTPEDAPRLRKLLGSLSEDNRYFRFQKWIGAPSGQMARHLADVHDDRTTAFVCTAGSDPEAEIVGDARYSVNADGASCEFGVMIADAWHNSGIAGLLMDDLIRAARGQGLKRMEGLVLATNSAMLRFARGLGFEVTVLPEDREIVHIAKVL